MKIIPQTGVSNAMQQENAEEITKKKFGNDIRDSLMESGNSISADIAQVFTGGSIAGKHNVMNSPENLLQNAFKKMPSIKSEDQVGISAIDTK